MTKASELRDQDEFALNQRLEESRRELFNLRFQLATGRLDNTARLTVVRREIARLSTVLHEQALGIRSAVGESSTRRRPRKATEEE